MTDFWLGNIKVIHDTHEKWLDFVLDNNLDQTEIFHNIYLLINVFGICSDYNVIVTGFTALFIDVYTFQQCLFDVHISLLVYHDAAWYNFPRSYGS